MLIAINVPRIEKQKDFFRITGRNVVRLNGNVAADDAGIEVEHRRILIQSKVGLKSHPVWRALMFIWEPGMWNIFAHS